MLKQKLFKLAAVTAAMGAAFSAYATTELKVAFNQSDKHPQFEALQYLSDNLYKKTDGRYKLNVYPNELLGDQRASLELVQNGAIQMAVVANPLVENYDKTFAVLGLPYLYSNSAHQEKVFTSDVLDNLFKSTDKFGFEVLTAYTAGARSVYTKAAPVQNMDDMKGKKIRVMQSDTMIKMLGCMGGTGVPMNQGEVYTAIQQGVLDGAENNEITYADLKQYEVAPHFSRTQHLMVADLVVVSTNFLQTMSEEDQKTLRELAKDSTKKEFELWNAQISKAEALAKEKGATFTEVDSSQFQQSCKPLTMELLKTPEQKALYEQIEKLK
ncbi:TRAP transporter substrate-binding protein [Pasteurellaceae bacterium TAE3-ERU1]|uniref:TRAP transporter substrate-binding protein n=1 Tax=Spirabiliibacterium mucosae TaxID=28156 RepID=UPI001AADF8A4|nr:TRAP transporter substrate-binding protein [Spirabiliibacterium mucosae]MBE2897303.1 TRAP transporter substrate-binding protein [Spirabiliibacterium mucosae]MBV7388836.1 TRAP transporter substrate-binding protein [Pasteurellaceae bacterium TAE3-ERU1]